MGASASARRVPLGERRVQRDEVRANPGPRAATCATLALMGTLNRGAMTALNFYIRDRRA